jgi:hypothetical protein
MKIETIPMGMDGELTGLQVNLSGNEVAAAITDYLEANGFKIVSGSRTVYVNDALCRESHVIVDPNARVTMSASAQDNFYGNTAQSKTLSVAEWIGGVDR